MGPLVLKMAAAKIPNSKSDLDGFSFRQEKIEDATDQVFDGLGPCAFYAMRYPSSRGAIVIHRESFRL